MYNILICDDERDIVAALKIYLEAEGYTTFVAFDGREALDVLRREKIHLVLMDVMMPALDGIAATAKLREESNVPVILLTAKSEDTDKVLGLNVGADDYVTKPFNPVELCARVRSQLRRYMQLGGGKADDGALTIGPARRGDGRPHADGIRDPALSDAPRGRGLSAPRALPPRLERRALRRGEHRLGPYPSYTRKAGGRPCRTALDQGRVGPGL